MPTYEYRCRACGHEFERFQKISAAPVRTCPACKKRRVERLISSGGGVVFKGSGFYATDYRKPAPAGSDSDREKGESGPSKPDAGRDASDGAGSKKAAGAEKSDRGGKGEPG